MMPKKPKPSKETLEEMYLVKKMTQREVGLATGYSDGQPIMRILREYGIPHITCYRH